MLHQQVNVDYWAMLKTMLTYGALTVFCWIMLRLFHAVFTFPRRLRSQEQNIQNTLQELQKRFPDLNITEEDLLNAEAELDELTKEHEGKDSSTEKDNLTDKDNSAEKEENTENSEENKKDN